MELLSNSTNFQIREAIHNNSNKSLYIVIRFGPFNMNLFLKTGCSGEYLQKSNEQKNRKKLFYYFALSSFNF